MKSIWIIYNCLVVLMTIFCRCSSMQHGICDTYQFNKKLLTCQAEFFEKLGESTDRETDCPSLYEDAVMCADKTAISDCYRNLPNKTKEMARERELELFGNQSQYCDYGGIPSIAPILLNLPPQAKCKKPVNETMVNNCEDPFYEEFRSDPGSSKLCSLAKNIRQCQVYLLSLCNKAFPSIRSRNQFVVQNSAHTTSVHCPLVKNYLVHPQNPDSSEGLNHPTAWNVVTPVLIIAVLMLLALLVGFCHYAKKEKKKNKQVDKDNKKKISERAQQIKQKNAGVEPRPQGDEMMPLSSVMTQEKEEISTV